MLSGRTLLFLTFLLGYAYDLQAQRPQDTRRGAGVRAGVWQVRQPADQPKMKRSAAFEGYVQRGLDDHLVVESSIGFWHANTPELKDPPAIIVETDTYIIPLITALKLYPLTDPDSRIEPFVLGGIGFALGIADEGDNALGGGGASILTGFGFKTGAGVEIQLGSAFGVSAGARYQLMRYREEIAGISTFKGIGFEGGITYRFLF